MLRLVLAAGLVAAAALPASSAVELVKPCHGTTYRYGALVWNPSTGEYMRMCIEQ